MTPLAAANAYASVQNSAGLGSGGDVGGAAAPGGDFGKMVQSAIGDAISSSHNAETQMSANLHGKASLIDVATAVSSAQSSLETVMAVRDQVISAYQEIMRMTI